MKITESDLRRLIQEEIASIAEEEANVGKDIKGGAASEKASQKITTNKTLVAAMDQITTTDSLASFLQDVIRTASQKGISQQEAISALKKVLSAASSSK